MKLHLLSFFDPHIFTNYLANAIFGTNIGKSINEIKIALGKYIWKVLKNRSNEIGPSFPIRRVSNYKWKMSQTFVAFSEYPIFKGAINNYVAL